VPKMDSALETLVSNAETGRLDPIFGSQHAIWVPPEVEVKALPLYEEGDDSPSIIYPVPQGWGRDATKANMFPLHEMGWQCKTDTSGLLNDFLRLAQEEETEKGLDAVQRFAKKWGPLWLCSNRHHIRRYFVDCYWSPTWPFLPYGDSIHDAPCSWNAVEPVFKFLQKAQQAKTVLDITVKLQNQEPVPREWWIRLHTNRIIDNQPLRRRSFSTRFSEESLAWQKFILSTVVNEHLSTLGTPRLWLHWVRDANLKLVCGLGFLRAVWVEIAQILGNVKIFRYCEACGTAFSRKRKQKYCPECRENDRGAKMMSARRRRSREG
jgi:hypothetical protein